MSPFQASLDEGRAIRLVGLGPVASVSAFFQFQAALDLSASLPDFRSPSQRAPPIPWPQSLGLPDPATLRLVGRGALGTGVPFSSPRPWIVVQLALSWPSHSSGLLGSPWSWPSWTCPSNRLQRFPFCRSRDAGRR